MKIKVVEREQSVGGGNEAIRDTEGGAGKVKDARNFIRKILILLQRQKQDSRDKSASRAEKGKKNFRSSRQDEIKQIEAQSWQSWNCWFVSESKETSL